MSDRKLSEFQNICIDAGITFVSFQLPQSAEPETHIQYSEKVKICSLSDISTIEKGFIFSPFDEQNSHTYLILPEISFCGEKVPNTVFDELEKTDYFTETHALDTCKLTTTTENNFVENVNQAKKEIEDNKFRKVVLSKVQVIEKPGTFSPGEFFNQLCTKYPHTFVYLIHIPEIGCWMGASPEPLLTSNESEYLTVSLAGTQKATGSAIESYSWADKELEEQQVVTRFIAKSLSENGISRFQQSPTTNYQAANLIHLRTEFRFDKQLINSNLHKLIQALHPTPSVGGLPRNEALNFIKAVEKHERSFYTGLLGKTEKDKDCQLYVNLRCMQIFDNHIVFYSGAGITASSVAENEWIETENKILTLKQVLFNL